MPLISGIVYLCLVLKVISYFFNGTEQTNYEDVNTKKRHQSYSKEEMEEIEKMTGPMKSVCNNKKEMW